MTTQVGLCGLGQMGIEVAGRLAREYDVVAVDLDDQRRTLADQTERVRTTSSLDELSGLDVVVLSLPSPAASRSVVDALASLLSQGSLVIETSTVLPGDARACGEALAAQGIAMVEAAVLSGVGQMRDGAATLLVGGPSADVDRARPVLQAIAPNLQQYGDLGTAMTAKVVNNGVAHAVMVVLVEAFAMAKAQGLDLSQLAEVLARPDGGLIRPLTHRMMERVATGDYEGGMPMDAARKDSTLALALGQASGVPLFATQAAQSVYDIALAHGLARQDYSAIATLWEKWSGTDLTFEAKEDDR
ncbi:NAD-binding protein [Epidermidibacterium keratini]|uniref:NAD-binding protein n=1 Tax=Epidermidibacterium keratini TaxID=1891644 RepID=A0A7L4YLA8_9ACTN|nr:NAD(P)-dependent oxidoreductase [Epidermidibacterium keratini]QHC00065.1 NAD-binding protein [Epidermidibacterium keratini]